MKEYKELMKSYKESMCQIQERIEEYRGAIAANGGEGNPRTAALSKKRYALYRQLWELQYAYQSLEEYVTQVTDRGEQSAATRIPITKSCESQRVIVNGL